MAVATCELIGNFEGQSIFFDRKINWMIDASGQPFHPPTRIQGNGRTTAFVSDITESNRNGWRLVHKWGLDTTWHKGTTHLFHPPYNELSKDDISEMWKEVCQKRIKGQGRYGY